MFNLKLFIILKDEYLLPIEELGVFHYFFNITIYEVKMHSTEK